MFLNFILTKKEGMRLNLKKSTRLTRLFLIKKRGLNMIASALTLMELKEGDSTRTSTGKILWATWADLKISLICSEEASAWEAKNLGI